MLNVVKRIAQYRSYHTNSTCVMLHLIGVPMILLSLMILLSWVIIRVPEVFSIRLTWFAILALVIYYCLLHFRLAVVTAAGLALLGLISQILTPHGPSKFNFIVFLVLFIVGWILQLIGHYFEKNRPALLDDLSQIFIAPLFIVAEIMFKYGYFESLKEETSTTNNQLQTK